MESSPSAGGRVLGPWGGRRALIRLATAVGLAVFVSASTAHAVLDLLSGAGWEASVDEQTWRPAYAPYPNPRTQPIRPSSFPIEPGASNANLMWFWDGAGQPDGSSGPDHAWFRTHFNHSNVLQYGSGFGAWIAADDWMQLRVNGQLMTYKNPDGSVKDYYALVEHQDPLTGQPVPVKVSIESALNWINIGIVGGPDEWILGDNLIEIEARDNAAFPGDFEWVFFDAQTPAFANATPPRFAAPEPPSMVTVALAMIAATLGSRRAANRRRLGGR